MYCIYCTRASNCKTWIDTRRRKLKTKSTFFRLFRTEELRYTELKSIKSGHQPFEPICYYLFSSRSLSRALGSATTKVFFLLFSLLFVHFFISFRHRHVSAHVINRSTCRKQLGPHPHTRAKHRYAQLYVYNETIRS